jgi:hypothetical protein
MTDNYKLYKIGIMLPKRNWADMRPEVNRQGLATAILRAKQLSMGKPKDTVVGVQCAGETVWAEVIG